MLIQIFSPPDSPTKIHKLGNIFATLDHGAGDGAIHDNSSSLNIAKNTFIRGRLTSQIMLRLQPVNRNRNLQIWQLGP